MHFFPFEAALLFFLQFVPYYLFEVRDFLFFLGADALERGELVELFRLVLFSLHGLAHTVGNRALVKGLVGLDGHLDLVTHTHQKETTLRTLDRDLADQLVEALGVELFTDGADASLASLAGLETLVQIVLEVDNVHTGCRGR